MILALLLQATLGLQAYTQQVERASWAPPAIYPPPILLVVPTKQSPTLISWVPTGGGVPPMIYATTDFLASAPNTVLQYVAYHEVCHVRMMHHARVLSWEEQHQEVGVCLDRHLGVTKAAFQKSQYEFYVRNVLIPLRLRTLR